jgi:ribosomal-protein-alanine N-acetyltransferase
VESIFETHRLALEPLRRSHAFELFAVLADPRLYRYVPGEPPADVASLAERFERLESRTSPSGDDRWLNWIVRVRDSGTCVGRIQVTIRPDRSAYLAYEIGAAFWRQGFATEACARVLRALFDDFGVSEIVAEVDTRNSASAGLLERLGFACTARREAVDFFKDAWSDEWTYVLRDDSVRTR